MPVLPAILNAIGTAVPDHDIHASFLDWAEARLDGRTRAVFARMAARAGIRHRWSVLPAGALGGGFYAPERFPSTAARMALYAEAAPDLAMAAIGRLAEQVPLDGITHLVVASCTGFVAPGIDQIVAARLGLSPGVERTLVGYMGCYAAIAALRLAYHIARSEPGARVLVVTVELSTLHLQDETRLEPLLAMLQFGDGAAAALVTGDGAGLALERPFSVALPDSEALIRWTIGDQGFAMHLSGEVPGRIATALGDPALAATLLDGAPTAWAVHAGGRSILDAVEGALGLPPDALADSRAVLDSFGNMSSATLMFVLARQLARGVDGAGVALAFGPGLAAEGIRFRRTA
ncbi:type III polyketide synthase [Sphingomonas jatrophae]|uniref:type III polyketide synthase n=1 Tax=Sphingomonas jatrophae TaxID=1166337 RepID=UPI000B136A6F|nr:type III polyketide synthase [Sphingomonas jatrophae]